jgi:hypothetical protein
MQTKHKIRRKQTLRNVFSIQLSVSIFSSFFFCQIIGVSRERSESYS